MNAAQRKNAICDMGDLLSRKYPMRWHELLNPSHQGTTFIARGGSQGPKRERRTPNTRRVVRLQNPIKIERPLPAGVFFTTKSGKKPPNRESSIVMLERMSDKSQKNRLGPEKRSIYSAQI
jgi:hypothetical protein